jgi:hypothetical protein
MIIIGDEPRITEPLAEQVIRYLRSLLAWQRASITLKTWIARLGSPAPVIKLVYIHSQRTAACRPVESRCGGKRRYHPEGEALSDILIDLPVSNQEKDILVKAINGLFQRPSGAQNIDTVGSHCETFVMSILKEASVSAAPSLSASEARFIVRN